MKFATFRTSERFEEYDNPDIVEINTLEGLLDYMREVDNEIIVYKDNFKNGRLTIEIYDDYRE